MSERSATLLPSSTAQGPTSTENGRTTTFAPMTTGPLLASMTASGPIEADGSMAIGCVPNDWPSSGRSALSVRGLKIARSSSRVAAMDVVRSQGVAAKRASTVRVAGSCRNTLGSSQTFASSSRESHPAMNVPSAAAWISPCGTRAADAVSSRPWTTSTSSSELLQNSEAEV